MHDRIPQATPDQWGDPRDRLLTGRLGTVSTTIEGEHRMRRRFWITTVIWAVVALAAPLVAGPSVQAQEGPFTGPLVAYEDYAGGRVIVQDLGAGTIRDYPFAGGSDPVWSPDGQRLAMVERNTRAIVVEVANGEITEIARDFAPCCENSDEFVGLDWFSPTEVALPTGRGGTIDAVAIDGSGRRIVADFGPGSTVTGLRTSPDGSRFLALPCDESFRCEGGVYDSSTGELLVPLPEDAFYVTWRPDSAEVAYSNFDGLIRAIDVRTADLTRQGERIVHQGTTSQGLVYTRDGRSLLFATFEMGRAEVRITSAEACCDSLPFDAGAAGVPVDLSPDGRWMALIDTDFGLAAFGTITRVGEGPVTPPEGVEAGAGSFSPVLPPGAPDVADPAGVTRLAGPTRFQTAVAVSQDQWGEGAARHAVVATADNFADAQTATPLAAGAGPLLLSAIDGLHPDTAAELTRVLPPGARVYVVGGVAALSEQVVADIGALGFSVTRLWGPGRAETSVAIAAEVTAAPTEIFFVDGGQFAPGILAGSVAGQRDDAVVVSGQAGVDYAARFPDAMVVQVGGTQFDPSADRVLDAATPSALSVLVARAFPITTGVALASADDFPDGLAGSAHAANAGRAVLLTPRDRLPSSVAEYLQEEGITQLVVYGGVNAIDPSVTQAALGG
ncbi:hypothetical protein BH23ACT9_BH23ACT9_34990 [soil metagenome]